MAEKLVKIVYTRESVPINFEEDIFVKKVLDHTLNLDVEADVYTISVYNKTIFDLLRADYSKDYRKLLPIKTWWYIDSFPHVVEEYSFKKALIKVNSIIVDLKTWKEKGVILEVDKVYNEHDWVYGVSCPEKGELMWYVRNPYNNRSW